METASCAVWTEQTQVWMCDVRNNTIEDAPVIGENKVYITWVTTQQTRWWTFLMNEAEIVNILLSDLISTLNLLIQGIHGYFKTNLILTLTALTDPTLARQNELRVFQRHVHSSSARGALVSQRSEGSFTWKPAGQSWRACSWIWQDDLCKGAGWLWHHARALPEGCFLTMAEPAAPGGLQLPVSRRTLWGGLVMHCRGPDQGFVVLVNH